MSLSVAIITSRLEPQFDWMFDSIAKQEGIQWVKELIVVDYFADPDVKTVALNPSQRHSQVLSAARQSGLESILKWYAPRPNIWGGRYMVTKEPWWHAAVSRNTAFCVASQPYIAMLDDRCVILPGWLKGVQAAAKGKYAVCGAYEKRVNMTVERGVIKHAGIVTGQDSREKYCADNKVETPFKCGGEWMFGCNFSLPIEWAMAVNGQDELSCGIGMDDVFFGMHLANAGFDIRFEPSMKIIEDRTASASAPVMRRENKKKSQNKLEDKDHVLLAKMRTLKRANEGIDLRQMRKDFRAGKGWPIPPINPSPVDWYDGQKISEFK